MSAEVQTNGYAKWGVFVHAKNPDQLAKCEVHVCPCDASGVGDPSHNLSGICHCSPSISAAIAEVDGEKHLKITVIHHRKEVA